MSGAIADIVLMEADIPGASLQEPLEVHNVVALKWWPASVSWSISFFFMQKA